MKTCRNCGMKLSFKSTKGQIDVAKRNIKHFEHLLDEEGQYLTNDQRSSIDRILYESRLALNDEVPFSEALCDKCRNKKH